MTTKFNELSTPLKILVVYGFIMMLVTTAMFTVGLLLGILSYVVGVLS